MECPHIKMNTMKTILSVSASVLALLGVIKVMSVNESETRSYIILHKDGNVMLRNNDASLMTHSDIDWVEEASATNVGTTLILKNFDDLTLMTIRQDYNHLGFRCGGDVNFK